MAHETLKKSDLIRLRVKQKFIRPALDAGQRLLSIKVKDVLIAMEGEVPSSRTPMVCQVLTGNKILEENGLDIERVDGPPSKQSRTVVVHYRVISNQKVSPNDPPSSVAETPAEKAFRLTEKIRGLLKNEIAAYGGAEAFMKWVRSDEEA